MENIDKQDKKKIVLSDELQKEIMKFFLKTSIPRIARKRREEKENKPKEKTLPEKEGQEIK